MDTAIFHKAACFLDNAILSVPVYKVNYPKHEGIDLFGGELLDFMNRYTSNSPMISATYYKIDLDGDWKGYWEIKLNG